MVMTTVLHQSEMNQKLTDNNVQEALDSYRETSGMGQKVQVTETKHRKRIGFWKWQEYYTYALYFEVGGVLPWQCVNFYSSTSGTSINPGTSAEVMVAYLYGGIGGIWDANKANVAKLAATQGLRDALLRVRAWDVTSGFPDEVKLIDDALAAFDKEAA